MCTCMQLPSTEEIEALFEDRKLNTIVFFLDETFEELSYDITASVLESVEQLAAIIKLQVKGAHAHVATRQRRCSHDGPMKFNV